MVSDTELVARLREFLRASDLNTTSIATVRRKLEQDFGLDLSHKKAFIREQVDLFITSEFNGSGEGDPQDDGEGQTEERKPESGGTGGEDEFVSAEEDVEEADDDGGEKANGGSSRKRRSKETNNEEGNRRGGGFNKLCSLSPQLQDLLGESELARTEVVKRLWAYIREKSLQDPSNKRNIICDEKLMPLFNVHRIDMFQMSKALSKHIWSLDFGAASSVTKEKPKPKPKPKNKPQNKEKEGKRQRTTTSVFLMPRPLSADMIKFIGTGESSLSRPEVVKRMWDYIKRNELQDPADKRYIICDDKLKDLFKVETFTSFGMSKLLTSHLIKENQ